MKKIIANVLMAAVIVTSCNATGDPNNFKVSGTIEHAPSKNIFLEQVNYDNTSPKPVDSAKLGEDGKYAMKAISKEEGLYLLTLDHKPFAVFINDNDDIRISADLQSNFRSPYVSNSEATKSIYEFLNKFRSSDSAIGAIYAMIDSLYTRNPDDSAVVDLQNKGAKELHVLNTYIKNYIQKSSSPAAVYYALNIAASRNVLTMPELDSLTKQSSTKFKQHAGLTAFENQLKQAAGATANNGGRESYSLLNQPAPDLTMNDVNGKPVSISSFKGKYVLVDFWASWCGPCRKENPNVVAAYNKFKNKNFTILGVSLDRDKEAWVQAIANDHLTWVQMSDLKQWESAAVPAYKFEGIPFNVLIDPSGKIIAESLRGPTLEAKLAEVLK